MIGIVGIVMIFGMSLVPIVTSIIVAILTALTVVRRAWRLRRCSTRRRAPCWRGRRGPHERRNR